jgi:hypothetical protein
MLRVTFIVWFVLSIPSLGGATTYYIDNAGSNANNGLTTGTPWLTFAHAMTTVGCGDTLVVMDGNYTETTNGVLEVAGLSCTAGNELTIQAQTERQAFLQGNGLNRIVSVTASSYVILDGLRVKSVDNAAGFAPAAPAPNVEIEDGSTHITIRNFLISHPNRYMNAALIRVGDATHNLIEDLELYNYHRHGIAFSAGATNNVGRRIYCNSRATADIGGGYVSGSSFNGDACASNYPGSNNIYENVISEGQLIGFDLEALGTSIGNMYLGVISLGDNFGMLIKARDNDGNASTNVPLDRQAQNTYVENYVAVEPIDQGFSTRGNVNTQCVNCTLYGTGQSGTAVSAGQNVQATEDGCCKPSGAQSAFFTNLLSLFATQATANPIGIVIVTSVVDSWGCDYCNAFGNTTNYSPSSNTNYDPSDTPTSTDPELGPCRVWIPDASPMKGAGLNGADIGGNVLYQYLNGSLTSTPAWDTSTGVWAGCGATVSGVNDTAGNSCVNVHERLNVNTNGCSFPAGYGAGGGGGGSGTSERIGRGSKGGIGML